MSDAYVSVPKNLRSLRDRLMHVSRRDGLAFGRLQQHIGVLVVSQFMASLTDEQGHPTSSSREGPHSNCEGASRNPALHATSTPSLVTTSR